MDKINEIEFVRRLEEFGFSFYTQYGKVLKTETTYNNRKCYEYKLFCFMEKDNLNDFKPYHIHLIEYAARWATTSDHKVIVLSVKGKGNTDEVGFASIKYKIKKI